MPIPKPKPNESEADFMKRCLSDPKMNEEYPANQRVAVCSAQFIKNNNNNNNNNNTLKELNS